MKTPEKKSGIKYNLAITRKYWPSAYWHRLAIFWKITAHNIWPHIESFHHMIGLEQGEPRSQTWEVYPDQLWHCYNWWLDEPKKIWFLLKQKNWFSWHHLNTWVDFTRAKSSFFCCQFQLLHAFPAQLFLTCQLQRLTILLVSQLSNPVKSNPTTPQIFYFPRNHFSTQKYFYLLQFQIKSASYNV